jgi:two-component system, cell cycle response regulator
LAARCSRCCYGAGVRPLRPAARCGPSRRNNKNGHPARDEALRSVARLIAATTRRTDLVARYGGEEFCVVLCGADCGQALQHAERLRRVIADHEFQHGAHQPLGRVSISIGVATFPDDAREVQTLFEAADQALYRAKREGRNRVAHAAISDV